MRKTMSRPKHALRIVDTNCPDCGRGLRHFPRAGETVDTATVCGHCALVREGVRPVGQHADGAVPRLHREPQSGEPWQECTGAGCYSAESVYKHRSHPLASLDDNGLCLYCRTPGYEFRGVGRDRRLKVFRGLALVYGFDTPFYFWTEPDGEHVLVHEVSQSGERRMRRVRLDETCPWGCGWYVNALDGRERCWLSDWDSSG